jgi:hypothetical protein
MSKGLKKTISTKTLLQSRGWVEVSNGVYIAEVNSNRSDFEDKPTRNNLENWDKKFEEAKAKALASEAT